MNIPRYATLAARLLRQQVSQLANPPGPPERDRGIEAIERALVARRRRARAMLVLVLVLVGMAVLGGLIWTMTGAADVVSAHEKMYERTSRQQEAG